MQVPRDSRDNLTMRRWIKELVLLSVVFLIALALFFATLYFIASKEANHELQNRPWGLLLGWLTTIATGLLLGKSQRKEEEVSPPKSIVIVRESLQGLMLLLFFGVLAYASYFVYTSRQLIVHRPWGLLIGWFAFLIFVAFFAKTRSLIQSARRK